MNDDTEWMFSFGFVVLKFTSVQRVMHTGWRLEIISIVFRSFDKRSYTLSTMQKHY